VAEKPAPAVVRTREYPVSDRALSQWPDRGAEDTITTKLKSALAINGSFPTVSLVGWTGSGKTVLVLSMEKRLVDEGTLLTKLLLEPLALYPVPSKGDKTLDLSQLKANERKYVDYFSWDMSGHDWQHNPDALMKLRKEFDEGRTMQTEGAAAMRIKLETGHVGDLALHMVMTDIKGASLKGGMDNLLEFSFSSDVVVFCVSVEELLGRHTGPAIWAEDVGRVLSSLQPPNRGRLVIVAITKSDLLNSAVDIDDETARHADEAWEELEELKENSGAALENAELAFEKQHEGDPRYRIDYLYSVRALRDFKNRIASWAKGEGSGLGKEASRELKALPALWTEWIALGRELDSGCLNASADACLAQAGRLLSALQEPLDQLTKSILGRFFDAVRPCQGTSRYLGEQGRLLFLPVSAWGIRIKDGKPDPAGNEREGSSHLHTLLTLMLADSVELTHCRGRRMG